jgi:phage gp16-like protein
MRLRHANAIVVELTLWEVLPMPSRANLAKIHIAKQALGLDDATYRGILRNRYQYESAADLDDRQAADLIELFQAKGWRPASLRQRGLMHVLWQRLAAVGAIRHADDAALNNFIAHATGRHDLRQLTVRDASHVIEMLKRWLERTADGDRRH